MEEDLRILYDLKRRIDEAVEENFGYCPNNDWFNSLEKEWREKELQVMTDYPNEYDDYVNKVYA